MTAEPKNRTYDINAAPHRMIRLDDCALPYWRFGQGPDLVFSHGWPLDSRTWRNIVPLLTDRFTCHLFDYPGTGQSEWDSKTRAGIAQNTAALAAVIREIGLTQYALLGHDSGGQFARDHAAQRTAENPDEIWGMVLGNTEIPGHHPWQLAVVGTALKLGSGSTAMLRAMLKSKLGRRLPIGFGGCFDNVGFSDPGFAGDDGFYELFVGPLVEPGPTLAGQLLLASGLDPEATDRLNESHAAIQAPVQLIWGERDPWFPLKKCRAMVDQFGGPVDLQVIPGKLFAHEEFAAQWADLAGRFLTDAAQSAGVESSARA